jgi:HD superfamily phosphohydrolase
MFSSVNLCASLLMESSAVQRLKNISFLGLLEPAFRAIVGWAPKSLRSNESETFSGTRFDHSHEVANVALALASKLALPEQTHLLLTAWAYTHDLATWPLSHSAEAAFERVCGIESASLREQMIVGDKAIPSHLRLDTVLRAANVDIDDLLQLYSITRPSGSDLALSLAWQIVRNPLTPDTLEGIFRCSRVWPVSVPKPIDLVDIFERSDDLFDMFRVSSNCSEVVRGFWRAKSNVYSAYINSATSLRWESAWSLAIQRVFEGVSLRESLYLPEHYILGRSEQTANAIFFDDSRFVEDKYKPPQRYHVTSNRRLDRMLLTELAQTLTKEPIRKNRAQSDAKSRTRETAELT